MLDDNTYNYVSVALVWISDFRLNSSGRSSTSSKKALFRNSFLFYDFSVFCCSGRFCCHCNGAGIPIWDTFGKNFSIFSSITKSFLFVEGRFGVFFLLAVFILTPYYNSTGISACKLSSDPLNLYWIKLPQAYQHLGLLLKRDT